MLFYDSLVAAADYFCAYIENGVTRNELTCFVGLSRLHYEKLLEQAGLKVAGLEELGYLQHVSTRDFVPEMERRNKCALTQGPEPERKGTRFIITHDSLMEQSDSLQNMIDFEKSLHRFSAYPLSTMCSYDARILMDEAQSNLFRELVNPHGHCFFQGAVVSRNTLVGTPLGSAYPKIRLR